MLTIMKISKFKNKFNKERNIENWSEYKHQRGFCSYLLKQSKKHHLNSLILKMSLKIKEGRKL